MSALLHVSSFQLDSVVVLYLTSNWDLSFHLQGAENSYIILLPFLVLPGVQLLGFANEPMHGCDGGPEV